MRPRLGCRSVAAWPCPRTERASCTRLVPNLCAVGVRNGTHARHGLRYRLETQRTRVGGPQRHAGPPDQSPLLELVCAEPATGGATYLLLFSLAKLVRTNTGILAHTVNAKSRALMERHAYVRPTRRNDAHTSRENALAHIGDYEGMLRTATPTLALCTRAGLSPRTSGRDFLGLSVSVCVILW